MHCEIIAKEKWAPQGAQAMFLLVNMVLTVPLLWSHNGGFARRPSWWPETRKYLCMRTDFISKRQKVLLFLPTKMAAVLNLLMRVYQREIQSLPTLDVNRRDFLWVCFMVFDISNVTLCSYLLVRSPSVCTVRSRNGQEMWTSLTKTSLSYPSMKGKPACSPGDRCYGSLVLFYWYLIYTYSV